MAFLFKSSKKSDKSGLPPASRGLTSSDGTNTPSPGSNYGSLREGQGSRMANQPPTGPLPPPQAGAAPNAPATGPAPPLAGASGPAPLNGPLPRGATPDQVNLREVSRNSYASATRFDVDTPEQQGRAAAGTPSRPPPDMSLYPWSRRKLDFATPNQSPFPRYGAASNALASPKGDVYLMGGLINGTMVKGDLWIVETNGSGFICTPIATLAEGPGPRVGHRALLVGNAFIVFGGDTKVEEMDVLDDTLYLLNTCELTANEDAEDVESTTDPKLATKNWSRALPAGPRPAGRYGHTLNILGSKIFIFGGQVEGHFFNDLVAFDLNALQQPSNRWEILIQNTADGGPPQGQVPAARTNHTIVTFNDRLYL